MNFKRIRIYACSYGKFGRTDIQPQNWTDVNSFGYMISEDLSLELINRSKPGASFYHLFLRINNDLTNDKIQNTDLILIQVPTIFRKYIDDEFSIKPHYIDTDNVSKVYFENIFNQEEETNKTISLILTLKSILGNNLFYNFVDGYEHFSRCSSPILFKLIKDDKHFLSINWEIFGEMFTKNMKFPCNHPNLEGHKHLANLYLELLKNRKFINY